MAATEGHVMLVSRLSRHDMIKLMMTSTLATSVPRY